jgi:hypothetical protein
LNQNIFELLEKFIIEDKSKKEKKRKNKMKKKGEKE